MSDFVMSRFALAAAASLTLVSGCIGSAVTNGADGGKKGGGGGGGGDVVDMSIDPRAEFNAKVLPLITQDCGSCHAQAGGSFPPFLVAATGGTVYDTFTTWPNLVGVTPATSEILTQPTHEGPSYADGTTATIKSHVPIISQWIVDYNAAGGGMANTDGGTVALTTPVAPTMGSLNTVKLDSLGASYKGMTITFTPTAVGSTEIKLTGVTLNATASAGATVTGTVVAFYASTDVTVQPATLDIDFNQDSFTAYEGGTALLGDTITPYTMGQYIAFSFTSIAPATGMPDMGGSTTACKDPTDFTAFKADLLANGLKTTNGSCISCHNTGGSGNSAFNMGGFTDNTMDATSCVTMLNYVNITTPNQSDVYQTAGVTPGKTHQGGKLSATDATTFLNALTKWLNGEQQ